MKGLDTRFAVYGTLRSGCGNDPWWHGLGVSEGDSTLDGFRLVTNGGFPYALPDERPDSSIIIEVIRALPGCEDELTRNLDRLEGYPRFYDRQIEAVELAGDTVACWIYVPADQGWLERLDEVPDGDWKQYALRATRGV